MSTIDVWELIELVQGVQSSNRTQTDDSYDTGYHNGRLDVANRLENILRAHDVWEDED